MFLKTVYEVYTKLFKKIKKLKLQSTRNMKTKLKISIEKLKKYKIS